LATKFRKIDDLARGLHSLLRPDDKCFYLIERTSKRGDSFTNANSIVANIKKKPGIASPRELEYKERDIKRCSRAMQASTPKLWKETATFVPVPPSKALGHPQYDDRMERICRGIQPDVDVRTLIRQDVSLQSSHERPSGNRITFDELLQHYSIDESQIDPEPERIAIVDDVLTAGTHFRAMHTRLLGRFPDAAVIGLFIARRIFPDDEQTDY